MNDEEFDEQLDEFCDMIIDHYLQKNKQYFGQGESGTNIGTLTNQSIGTNMGKYGQE